MGLRACELAALRLDDIGWRTGSLRIRGKGDRIDELPLPEAVPGGPVGSVDLDDVRAVTVQVAGQSGAIRSGAFYAEAVVRSEVQGPAVQLLVAGCCGWDGELPLSAAEGVDGDGDMDVIVGVDADDDGNVGAVLGHAGDGLLLAVGVGAPPVRRADRTATRPGKATLL